MFQTEEAEKIKIYILYVQQRFSENREFYEIMWKIMAELDRPQMKIRCMRFAHWIIKPRYTHSEYLILTVVRQQQWLHGNVTMLR